jgi:ketosteroid isomerase-like protein
MADESTVLQTVRRYFEFSGADVERAEEIYHDDAVLEFPQSGERFEGVATFTEWRRQYPTDPDQVRYRVRRVTARVDLACRGVVGQLRQELMAAGCSAAGVPRRQGGARADLCNGRLGSSGLAEALALGHASRPAR